jgi:hypothetical protein
MGGGYAGVQSSVPGKRSCLTEPHFQAPLRDRMLLNVGKGLGIHVATGVTHKMQCSAGSLHSVGWVSARQCQHSMCGHDVAGQTAAD